MREVILSQTSGIFNLNPSDGKEAKEAIRETNQVVKQTANDVDLVKRPLSTFISLLRPTVFCR